MKAQVVALNDWKTKRHGRAGKQSRLVPLPDKPENVVMPMGKHRGRLLCDIPLPYLAWAAEEAPTIPKALWYAVRREILRRLDVWVVPAEQPAHAPRAPRKASTMNIVLDESSGDIVFGTPAAQ